MKENFAENFIQSLKGIIKIILKSRFGSPLPKESRKSDECVVLGNGPSAAETLKNKDFLKGKDIFCVNSFSLSEEYVSVKPDYYVFADPGFFSHQATEATLTLRKKVFEAIASRTTWNMVVFIPYGIPADNELQQLCNNSDKLKFCRYNINSVKGFRWFRHWAYKSRLAIPPATNVLVPALMHAVNLGYKTVYLTGADHSWIENIYLGMDNVLYMKNVHFYENETKVSHLPVIDAATQKRTDMISFFSFYLKVFQSYSIVNSYALLKKSKIINISVKTFVDIFERQHV